MITDEAGCIWQRVRYASGPLGEELVEYHCQHAGLAWVMQRQGPREPWVERYTVEGIAQHFKSPGHALTALRSRAA